MTHTLSVNSSGPLGHCWGLGNRLLVYSRWTPTDNKTRDAFVHEVRWDVSLSSNEFTRRLIRTSFDVFCALQKNSDPEKCISFSRQYRAALAMCSQEILQFLKLNDNMDEAKAVHLASLCDLIEHLELIWHLAELIFIQAFPAGHLTYNLCNWFHVQHQEAIDDARALIESTYSVSGHNPLQPTLPEQDERFWPTVLALVLQARPHDAASVLAMHSHSNSRGLRCLRQLLVAMPIASPLKSKEPWSKSGATFPQVWNYWQSECIRRLSSGEFDQASVDTESAQHILLILSILAGRPVSWEDERIVHASGGPRAWYFRFVSFLFYTEQMATVEDLSSQLNRWFTITDNPQSELDNDTDHVIDALITSVFRLDFQAFIRYASEKLESWWLVAHFTNLMHHVYPDILQAVVPSECDMSVTRTKPEELGNKSEPELSHLVAFPSPRRGIPSLPEFFILNYADSLASDLSLLSVALGYLDYCEDGASRQKGFLLAHGNPVSTRSMNWFIAQAQCRKLVDVGEQLARECARRFLPFALHGDTATATGDYSDAVISSIRPLSLTTLGWALFGKDYRVVNRLVEEILARDRGFVTDRYNASTEIAELAAVVLGFHRDDHSPEPAANSAPKGANRLRLSPELAFLIRYAELQQCFTVGNEEVAIDRLIDLLITSSGGSTPTNYPGNTDTTISDIRSTLSTRLRLRLLSEVRHLLGRNCIRRDQVELLIATLVDLRSEFPDSSTHADQDSLTSLSQLHMLLAQELASSALQLNNSTVPRVSTAFLN